MTLPGWTTFSFTHDGLTRNVYRRGSGPGVLVMHEIPGITPHVEAFARRVADEGYTVFMPDLFGEVGRPLTPGYALGQMARACIRSEFAVLAGRGSSPVTRMLRALCLRLHEEAGGPERTFYEVLQHGGNGLRVSSRQRDGFPRPGRPGRWTVGLPARGSG